MARSAQAYVWGNTRKFYEWVKTAEVGRLPRGPAVWMGGDCHLGNLGPLADENGDIDIQIRDLDQSAIGTPVHDPATARPSGDVPRPRKAVAGSSR